MTNLSGKVALITGSTSGIGLGIAKSLAEQKINIIFNGFGSKEGIAKIRAEVEGFGVKSDFYGHDLIDESAISQMMAEIKEKWGGVDILVNNAGIQHVAKVENFPVEKWNQILALNLSAVFHTSRLAIPYMLEKNWGRIINVASVHGSVSSVQKSAYVASKHGVIGLTKVVALENAKTGVTCNAICPGWVLTPLVEQQILDRAKRENVSFEAAQSTLLSEKQPSEQFVTSANIGALVVFLCGEVANEVRGAAWNIDGGWLAQ